MTNLVRMIEEVCQKESGIIPSVITLQVASYSHLAQHTVDDLQTMFDFVAKSTLAEGAKLEVTTKVVNATCITCEAKIRCEDETLICPNCGSGEIDRDAIPEVLLKNIKYTEHSS
jgi:hydrogenase nickel incorporation protein HypA/HybF